MHEALGLASNITEMGVELQACAFKACNSSRDRRGRSSEPSSCTVLAAFLLLRKSSLTENNLGEERVSFSLYFQVQFLTEKSQGRKSSRT